MTIVMILPVDTGVPAPTRIPTVPPVVTAPATDVVALADNINFAVAAVAAAVVAFTLFNYCNVSHSTDKVDHNHNLRIPL